MKLHLHTAIIAVSAAILMSISNAQAEPLSYKVDNAHTHIVWEVDRFGFANTVGTFTEITGSLLLDEANPEQSQVRAEIALSGLRSDLIQREDIIRSEFWLNAKDHPLISFRSTRTNLINTPDCETSCADVEGVMSLNGVEAPLTLRVRLNKIAPDPVTGKKAVGFTATGSFERSTFNIRTALGPIGDTVNFKIHLLALSEN